MLQRNADGTFIYCGRADDMLKISGKWLSPGELENCLLQHEHVREAAVVGDEDDDGLVKPWAFVVSDQPTESSPRICRPSRKLGWSLTSIRGESSSSMSLPRTHLGKVDRKELAGYFRLRSASAGAAASCGHLRDTITRMTLLSSVTPCATS